MRYINTKTGAILDSPCVLSGGYWELLEKVKESKEAEESKEKIIEIEKESETDDSDVVDLSKMSINELKKLAKELELDFDKNIKKDELIAFIGANQEIVED